MAVHDSTPDTADRLEPIEVQYAAGMVMAFQRVGAGRAFTILRRHAVASRRPLTAIAEELVETDPGIDREHLLLTITESPGPDHRPPLP